MIVFLTTLVFATPLVDALPLHDATPVHIPSVIAATATTSPVPIVPFYSQFKDIQSPKWQKIGCGIASLAMLIDFYSTDPVSVNTLLKKGVAAGAYDQNAGWTYKGLITLSRAYGLDGTYYDWSSLDQKTAFSKLKILLQDGPVMLSVHYKFDPRSTIPHLVVINGIEGDVIYYNDPAEKSGAKEISTAKLLKAWKKKVVIIRPAENLKEKIAFAN